jgi:hypothetical protein
MGADIHMVLERKNLDTGNWVGLHAFSYVQHPVTTKQKRINDGEDYPFDFTGWDVRHRNYSLFAALAGVRGDGPEPRGIPEDVSELAQMEINHWGSDGHSHTWYSIREALPLFVAHMMPEEILGSRRPYLANDLFNVDADEVDEHRLIIWFDN